MNVIIMKKIIRVTTIPGSLGTLLKGQLKYMSNYFEIIGVSSSGNNVLDNVGLQENIKVLPVEMSRKITPFKDLKSIWIFYKILKNEKPLIVHTHTPKAGLVGMLASYIARVPHRLHTVAGMPLLEVRGVKRILLDFVEKLIYFCSTRIYPNSFGLKEIILENKYTSPNKIKVIGNGSSNGIDTNYFNSSVFTDNDNKKLKKKLGIHKDDFIFIFVGRLVKDKGINELVGAFNDLNKENKDITLLLVGEQEEELDPLFSETISLINTNKKIIPVGWQKDVRPYFAIADILTFPSYREGFPNAVLQAASMGLPSIVTNINGCNEIINHLENGILIEPKNQKMLKNSMRNLITKNDSISNNEIQIREAIIKKYSREEVWKQILLEYNSISVE